MATISMKKRIEAYCSTKGIVIPIGFGRNAPSRYAIIRKDSEPPKLVAKTWSKHEDVAYYLQTILVPELGQNLHSAIDILDFKEGKRLQYVGSTRLQATDAFI